MTNPKQGGTQNRKLIFSLLFFWLIGMIIAWLTNRITELLIVSVLVIVFLFLIARNGLMRTEILDKPLITELLVNLPYDEAFDQCVKSLTTIHGDIDSSSKEWGSIVAIPVGVPVFTRYFNTLQITNFIEDRISFKLIMESKTKTWIKIRHNLEKGSIFKLQKEQEKMNTIGNYLRQWEVKSPDTNS